MSLFTSTQDFLQWIYDSFETGFKHAGKTFGMSLIAVIGIIIPISLIAVITLTITHFIRKKRGQQQQPGFVQRANQKERAGVIVKPEPDFLKKARQQTGAGNISEPDFVRKAREKQKGEN